MPRGDRRGPEGMGPMTGRGLGFCSGQDSPGYTKGAFGGARGMGLGRGFGRGLGFGRGYAWRARADYTPAVRYHKGDELEMLKEEAKYLREDLESVNARIEKLEKD
jgi:hypothetical protein